MKNFLLTIAAIFGILLIIGVFIAIPLLAISAVNTLFGTNIAYTALNWLAMTFLGIFFRGLKINAKSNKE